MIIYDIYVHIYIILKQSLTVTDYKLQAQDPQVLDIVAKNLS